MKLKGKAGIVLAVLAGVGMIFTIVLTAKKAPEAQKAKDEALEQKRKETGDENTELTKIESLKAQTPVYAPVIFSAMATVGSLVGSQILPQSTIENLSKWKQTYRDISAKVNGPKAEAIINQMTEKKLTTGEAGIKKETFVLQYGGKDILFDTTLLDVYEAEYDTNRFFAGTGEISVNQMLQLFHLEPVEQGDDFGWNIYLGEAWYGYCWIDFNHERGMREGEPVTFIRMPFEAHALNEEDNDEITFGTIQNHGIEGTA